QWQDSIKARQGLEQSLANATQRYTYYQKLLGRTDSDIQGSIPRLDPLDQDGLQKLKFQSNESEIPFDRINVDIAKDTTKVSDGEITTISTHESLEIVKLQDARDKQISAADSEGLAATLGFIPDFSINLEPFGLGASTTLGGSYISKFPASSARGD